jgi:hypothetical protein
MMDAGEPTCQEPVQEIKLIADYTATADLSFSSNDVYLLQPFPFSTRISLVSDFLAHYGLSRPHEHHKLSYTAAEGAFVSPPVFYAFKFI